MCNAGSDAAAIDLNMCLVLLTRLTSVAHGQTDGRTRGLRYRSTVTPACCVSRY